MKIALLIDSLGTGGAQRQIILLAGLLAKKHDVCLYYYGESADLLNWNKPIGFDVCHVSKKNCGSKFGFIFKLMIAIFSWRPSVLISYLDGPNKIGFIYKLVAPSVKWFPSERNICRGSEINQIIWRKLLFRFAANVTANSYCQIDWLKKNLPKLSEKFLYVPNGIMPKFFLQDRRSIRMDTLRVLCLGRMGYQKYPELILSAIKLLAPSYIARISVSWYGEEDVDSIGIRDKLNRVAHEGKLPVRFFEPIQDTVKAYQDADLMVLTSRFEGTPNVVLEAMAGGLAVLASDVSDIPKILENSRGFIFPSGDAECLAKSLTTILDLSGDELADFGARGKSHAYSNFSIQALERAYAKIVD